MTTTVTFRFPLATIPALRAEMYARNSPTVVNGGGSGSDCTITTKGCGSFTFAETLSPDVMYDIVFYKVSDGSVFSKVGTVWIEYNGGTFGVNDDEAFARFMQMQAINLQAVERSTDDTRDIEFTWSAAGDSPGSANIGGSPAFTTKTRRFKPLATLETISGAITFIGTIGGQHWWKLAYNIADRADDGQAIVPVDIEYSLQDSAGRTETFTLVIFSATASSEKVAY